MECRQVARIVNEAFGLQVISERSKIEENIRRLNSVQEFKEQLEDPVPFLAGDFKVWDEHSQQHIGVLESISEKLLELHSRWWAEINNLAMEKKRMCHWMESVTTPSRKIADELAKLCTDKPIGQYHLTIDQNRRDFIDIMTIVRDALLAISRDRDAAMKRQATAAVAVIESTYNLFI